VHDGAQDYLVKGEINSHLLSRSIRYAIERKRSELALLQAEEKYRSIFENTVEGIFQTTPCGKYISANSALARIYGYSTPEDLINTMQDISTELYVESGRRQEFCRLMEQHNLVTGFESQVYRRDRSVIWISENVRTVRNRTGTVVYYEGTVEDITERKRVEQEVRNSEALYHSLVETLPQNIFRKNLAEQFTFANQRFCQTLGRSLSEIVGKTDFDFFPAELAAKYQKDDQLILETGKTFETVEENQPPGGEKRYVFVVKTPLYDAEGKIIGLQGIFWDITEKKRAEEQARRATNELARSREELRAKNEQMEEDLRMAREIQQAIIPIQYPCFPKNSPAEESCLKFCHRYLPSGAVGGDFFNVRALSDTKAAVFICDVMGHGVRSALVTAILRALVEELTHVAADPGQLLQQINRDMRSILKQSGTPLFTTAFYMIADLEERRVYYANAGHPKPMVIHRQSGQIDLLQNKEQKSNPALGIFDNTIYSTNTYPLKENDAFVLFTDGVYDVEREGELLSIDWLKEEFQKRGSKPLPMIFDEILGLLREYSEGADFTDDVCLVGMEFTQKALVHPELDDF
jgi:sigma-B regulation protein RsbU (phosphoserine phosphatase)